jgi:hypothetical protein
LHSAAESLAAFDGTQFEVDSEQQYGRHGQSLCLTGQDK